MAVRVKIKVDSTKGTRIPPKRKTCSGKLLKTVRKPHQRQRLLVALINTGFETLKPQLLLPIKAAQELSLWPNLPTEAKVEIYGQLKMRVRGYEENDFNPKFT